MVVFNYKEILIINIKFASNKLAKFLSSWTQEQLIQFIKTQAHPQIEELLEDFLSSQELLATANEKHRKVLQQTYQQAKNELAAVISQEEIEQKLPLLKNVLLLILKLNN